MSHDHDTSRGWLKTSSDTPGRGYTVTIQVMSKSLLVLGLIATTLIVVINAQNDAHKEFCRRYDGSCNDCLKASNDSYDQGGKCYFCKKTDNGTKDACLALGFSLPIAAQSSCPNFNYNLGSCSVPVIVWIVLIIISVVVVVACFFVICGIICCLCCCGCTGKKKRKIEEMEHIQERDAIHQRSAERRENRKAKNDEIRKKYGLGGDTVGTYTRFD